MLGGRSAVRDVNQRERSPPGRRERGNNRPEYNRGNKGSSNKGNCKQPEKHTPMKQTHIQIRVSKDEKAYIQQAAEKRGWTMSKTIIEGVKELDQYTFDFGFTPPDNLSCNDKKKGKARSNTLSTATEKPKTPKQNETTAQKKRGKKSAAPTNHSLHAK